MQEDWGGMSLAVLGKRPAKTEGEQAGFSK